MGSYGQRNAQEGNLKSLQENTPESLQENNQEAFQEANQQASQPMDDSPSLQGEYLLPEVGLRYLSQEELQELSPQQLRYARYEIYALHGRRFKSQELQDYFGSKSWYQGSIDDSSPKLAPCFALLQALPNIQTPASLSRHSVWIFGRPMRRQNLRKASFPRFLRLLDWSHRWGSF